MADLPLWRAVAGVRGGRPPADDPAAALRALRDAGVPTRDIAERLGVSPRTVQRWLAPPDAASHRNPARSRSADRIREMGRSAPEVRGRALSPRRASRMRNQGGRVRIRGNQGPAPAGKRYFRERQIERELDGYAMEEIMTRWAEGDDEGAAQALRDALDAEGYPEWEWDPDAAMEFLGHVRE